VSTPETRENARSRQRSRSARTKTETNFTTETVHCVVHCNTTAEINKSPRPHHHWTSRVAGTNYAHMVVASVSVAASRSFSTPRSKKTPAANSFRASLRSLLEFADTKEKEGRGKQRWSKASKSETALSGLHHAVSSADDELVVVLPPGMSQEERRLDLGRQQVAERLQASAAKSQLPWRAQLLFEGGRRSGLKAPAR